MAKTRAQMEEENRAAAEQMLPLPHDLPAPSVPLMEMPVDEFLGALPEITGGDQEQTDFLMREYNRVNSLTGEMNSEVPEGRTGIAGNFLSKPEGSTGWDAVRGLRVEPRAGATGVAQGVEQALTAPGRAAQGTMPAEDMTMEALGAASLGAAPGLASAGKNIGRVDESMVSMFGTRGTSAQDMDPARLNQAVEMKRQGLDDTSIWEDTGLEWNPELQDWEFEIDTSGLRMQPEMVEQLAGRVKTESSAFAGLYRSIDDQLADDPKATIQFDKPLGDMFDFEDLYTEYPFLSDAKIHFMDGPGASYDGATNTIEMGLETMRDTNMKLDPENFKSILVHELQHGIQSVNSLAPGGSNNLWILQNDPEVLQMVERAVTAEDMDAAKNLAYNKYKADAGEIQARAAQMRREMSEGERRETPPSVTYRMALNQQMEKYRTPQGQNMPTTKRWDDMQADLANPQDVNPGFAEGGLVSDVSNNAMADYFKAASGMMSEAEFTGKHKMSTRVFEDRFEEQNNVDISGAESFKEITGTSKGDNMPKNLNNLAQGGMPSRDPVSGNEIPLGSGPENVRDDIDANLSEGEYVLPAHVVKFIGVANIEDMIATAEEGLQEMASNGRIGGDQSPQQMEEPVQMAEGGYVSDNTNFNTADYSVVGSQIGKQGGSGFEYVPYYGPNGATMSVLMINGMPAQTIPEGWTANPGATTDAEPVVRTNRERSDRPTNPAFQGASATGALGDVPDFSAGDPLAEVDFSDPSAVIEWANNRLDVNNNFLGDWGDRAATILGGVVGGPAGALLGKAATQGYGQMRDVAVINAAALEMADRGDTETADRLRAIAEKSLKGSGLVGRLAGSSEELMTGENIHNAYRESRGDSPAAANNSNTARSDSGSSANPVTRASTSNDSGRDYSGTGTASSSRSNQTASGGYGSSTNAPTTNTGGSKERAAAAATRSGTVSSTTANSLSGATMRAGNEVGSGAGGSNRVGPMNKGGLVSRPKKY